MAPGRLTRIARKLHLIAASDLAHRDKFRYALRCSRFGGEFFTYRLRGGVSVALRKGSTDAKVFDEIFVERVYAAGLAALPTIDRHVTLIDLGAYTGFSALFLARGLAARGIVVNEIVAVEPDPDNFRMLLENLRTTGLAARTTALQAFAGAEHAFAEVQDSGNGAWGMRMGRLSDTGTPVLPMAEIANTAKINAPILLKCDIEGGERQLFLHIRDWAHLIHSILIELHTEFLPVREMLASLQSSGFHWTIHGASAEGAVIAFFLLERGAAQQADNATIEACPSMTIAKTHSKSTSSAWAWSEVVWRSRWTC
jgi:FkbM family methyltransferase